MATKNIKYLSATVCALTIVFWTCSLEKIDPSVKYDPCLGKVMAKFAHDKLGVSCDSPCVVKFTNQTNGAKSYAWDFGEGGKSTEVNPTYTFKKTGRFTVKLTATDENGCRKEATEVVTVTTPNLPDPIPDFTFSHLTGNKTAPTQVVFTNRSQNAATYKWYFGEGQDSSDFAFPSVYTYTIADDFSVTLEAYNKAGVKRSITKTVSIQAQKFVKYFGLTADNTVSSDIIITNEHGYAVVGTSTPLNAPTVTYGYIAKIDSQGIELPWGGGTNRYVNYNTSKFKSIVQTADGGFVVAGTAATSDASDVLLVKFVATGFRDWEKLYTTPVASRPLIETVNSLEKTADGGFLLCGAQDYLPNPPQISQGGMYLIKTNASGDTTWKKRLDGTVNNQGFVARQSTDGKFNILGTIYSSTLLIKADKDNLLNNISCNIKTADIGVAPIFMSLTKDNGYICCGGNKVFKMDGACNVGWVYSNPQIINPTSITCVQQCKDGNYIACGGSFLIKINKDTGVKMWEVNIDKLTKAQKVLETPDGGFVIIGTTNTIGSSPQNQIMVVKTDKKGSYL